MPMQKMATSSMIKRIQEELCLCARVPARRQSQRGNVHFGSRAAGLFRQHKSFGLAATGRSGLAGAWRGSGTIRITATWISARPLLVLSRWSLQIIVPGNGSSELIRLFAEATFEEGDTALIPVPTFGEYENQSSLAGGRIKRMKIGHDGFPLLDESDLLQAKALFLCNPNNPTGRLLSKDHGG